MELTGEFTLNGKNMSLPEVKIDRARIIDKDFCPICIAYPRQGISTTEEAFTIWYNKRLVSDHRPDIPKREQTAPSWVPFQSQPGQMHPNVFSLTDQYWIRFEKRENWKDMNFFTNSFSQLVGAYYFTPNREIIERPRYFFNSPDLTVGGIQPKRWIRDEDDIYLFKYCYKEKDLAVLSEVLAAYYLRKWNCIPFVDYRFGINLYKLCSKSKCFINESQEFVPASHIYHMQPKAEDANDNFEHLLDCVELCGMDKKAVAEFIDLMIEVDRRLLNFDRHFGNFGFIRNVDTGKFEGPAPLFDFGSAYFLSEVQERKLRAKEASHLFKMREKKLIRSGKIKPLTDYDLPEELYELPVDSTQVDRIKTMISLNNDFIISNLNTKNKLKEQENRVNFEPEYGIE